MTVHAVQDDDVPLSLHLLRGVQSFYLFAGWLLFAFASASLFLLAHGDWTGESGRGVVGAGLLALLCVTFAQRWSEERFRVLLAQRRVALAYAMGGLPTFVTAVAVLGFAVLA